MKYRKKPVVIEAFRYYVDNRPDWFQDKVTNNEIITFEKYCEIKTLEGVMTCHKGDYIIRGIIEGLKLAQHINSIAVTDYDYSTKLQSAIDAVQWLSRKDL